MKHLVVFLIFAGFAGFAYAQSDDYSPSGRDYVPYTENYNVKFTHDGKIDYDLLILKIMPSIFEEKLRDMGVDVSASDIVLNRGPQLSIYRESSSACGYVIDYSDDQVYWLQAGINSTAIRSAEIFTETPKPNVPSGVEIKEWNLGWCFGPLKEQVAAIFLKEKSHLTEDEESVVAAAVKHELRGNPTLGNQEFKVGKFNFDYGDDVLAFCGEFQKSNGNYDFFGGAMYNSILDDFHLEGSLPPLCAISDDAKVFSVSFSNDNPTSGLEKWKNNRMETVYLKPSSVEKLLERNYMMVRPAHNMILEYSTSLDVEFISYLPNDSNTVFEIKPSSDDTFVKIRVPQNGGNYYMSYGPNEWNKGDLTDVMILVDGVEVPYKEQPFVQSPDAPYPQYFTDYIFKFPANSSMLDVILFIENYVPDSDHSDDEWDGYAPPDDY